jgi:hypothetical protein
VALEDVEAIVMLAHPELLVVAQAALTEAHIRAVQAS